jgi:hypothetical protein
VRRELIWVAIIGISFGLIIAFGVWRINTSLDKSKPGPIQPTPFAQNPGEELKVTLNTPENDDVVTVSPVSVSGITKPLAWIVVSGTTGDYILQSDENGIFSQNVDLTPGINQIKITALDSNGSQTLQKVLVVYSSAFQLQTVNATPGIASGEASINENVAQKVAAAMNRPKAYLGVVTDITNTTIQIKDIDSQIQQISVGSTGLSVVDTKGTNNKQIKLTDIAIGDFIVAMGYINSNQVLSAQRILITDPLSTSQLSISLSSVTTVTKKSLTVTDIKSGQSATLTPDKNTEITSYVNAKTSSIKITGVNTNDLVIYVTNVSGTPPLLRSIFDLGKTQS